MSWPVGTRGLSARLAAAVTRREEAEQRVRNLVAAARAEDVSWTEIARSLGVTKQAAQQRYGR